VHRRKFDISPNREKEGDGEKMEKANSQSQKDRKDSGNMDDSFWALFYWLYLNKNKLSLPVAYSMARESTQKINPFAIIPTLPQVRYQVGKIDKKIIDLARNQEPEQIETTPEIMQNLVKVKKTIPYNRPTKTIEIAMRELKTLPLTDIKIKADASPTAFGTETGKEKIHTVELAWIISLFNDSFELSRKQRIRIDQLCSALTSDAEKEFLTNLGIDFPLHDRKNNAEHHVETLCRVYQRPVPADRKISLLRSFQLHGSLEAMQSYAGTKTHQLSPSYSGKSTNKPCPDCRGSQDHSEKQLRVQFSDYFSYCEYNREPVSSGNSSQLEDHSQSSVPDQCNASHCQPGRPSNRK
jgi:hypothetical protein